MPNCSSKSRPASCTAAAVLVAALVILDFQDTATYARTLREAGATDVRHSAKHWTMHPPVRMVTARS